MIQHPGAVEENVDPVPFGMHSGHSFFYLFLFRYITSHMDSIEVVGW